MSLLTQPQARIPLGWAMVDGKRVPVEIDIEWMRYLVTLDERVGGATGISTAELELMPRAGTEDAAAIQRLQDEAGPASDVADRVTAIQTQLDAAALTPAIAPNAGFAGPYTSTDNAIARWDGTGGNTIQNSVVTVSDTGAVAGVTTQSMSGALTSTLATGTAPFTIASTTKVANLNVDSLDDQSGAYYLDSANFTGANWTDLTDAGATTLHKHDHGGQDGLGDDDHTQYLLANGTRALSADWDAGSFEIRAQTFESDVTTGTAPLVIASTTKVDNLHVARATLGDTVTVANEATDTSCFLLFGTAATGNLEPKTNANLTFDSSTGSLTISGLVNGIGGAANAKAIIHSLSSRTGLTVDSFGYYIDQTYTFSGAVSEAVGVIAHTRISDGSAINADAGKGATAFSGLVLNANAAAVTNLYGFRQDLRNTSTGTVTNAVGSRVVTVANSGGGTITNVYGFLCSAQTVGSTLNAAFAGQIASGTGRWNAYMSGTADNAFAGNVRIGSTTAPTETLHVTGTIATSGIGAIGTTTSSTTALNLPASTTGVSSIRLAHGSAPSAPVNGDMWTTTAGLYVRINGATVGPLA